MRSLSLYASVLVSLVLGSLCPTPRAQCPEATNCPIPVTDAPYGPYSGRTDAASAVLVAGVDTFLLVDHGTWTELSGGQAHLTGTIMSVADNNNRFTIDVTFTGRTNVPPSGSPKKELQASAYAPQGPVDPAQWTYYPGMTATLLGTGGYDGAELTLTRRGPAFQVGFGANGRDTDYGGSGWFTVKVVKQSRNKKLYPTGDGDFNLTFGDCFGEYALDNGDYKSSDGDATSTANAVQFGLPVTAGSTYVLLDKDIWKAATQNSTQYNSNRIRFTITPTSNHFLNFNNLCLSLRRDNGSVVRYIDVRANGLLGGTLQTITLPATTSTATWDRFCIDLTNLWSIQGRKDAVTIDLHLWGSAKTATDTKIDDICVNGWTSCCLPSHTFVLQSADCNKPGAPTLLASRATLGGTLSLAIDAPAYPNAMGHLFGSIGASNGTTRMPGTNCRIWITGIGFWDLMFMFDGKGHFGISVPVPNLAVLAGVDFGLQALAWHTSGDWLSNGLVVKFGCN